MRYKVEPRFGVCPYTGFPELDFMVMKRVSRRNIPSVHGAHMTTQHGQGWVDVQLFNTEIEALDQAAKWEEE